MAIRSISDLHLDAMTHGVPRRDEILRSVHWQLELIQEGDTLVVAGDVGTPGSNRIFVAISDAIDIDRRAKQLGARDVWWLVGNHDVLEDGSGLSILAPLEAAGCTVVAEPMVKWVDHGPGKSREALLFLPHAPLAGRYDPAEAVERLLPKTGPVMIVGHLNPEGITPGSEVSQMARGRDVFWPKLEPERRILLVGGHIHRAQEYPRRAGADRDWGSIHIVGSPVRFDFSEAEHFPHTFEASWNGKDWVVDRRPVGSKLAEFHTCGWIDEEFEVPHQGDFVRGIPDDEGEFAKQVKGFGATFVPLPKLAEASPKAQVSREARKHRRVRDVVLDVARAYPSAKSGLLDRVEKTLERNEL